MKLLLNLQNDRINLFKMLDFKLWELMYELNKDVIESYTCIQQTDLTLEYIFTFFPISIFPPMYSHMVVQKEDNKYTARMVENSGIKTKYVKLESFNEEIHIHGTDHSVVIEISFDLSEETQILENVIKIMFKKILQRIKLYVESL
jgi:hypothetical protein